MHHMQVRSEQAIKPIDSVEVGRGDFPGRDLTRVEEPSQFSGSQIGRRSRVDHEFSSLAIVPRIASTSKNPSRCRGALARTAWRGSEGATTSSLITLESVVT